MGGPSEVSLAPYERKEATCFAAPRVSLTVIQFSKTPKSMNITERLIIRVATLADHAAANAIHKAAYPEDPYTYANNIGRLGTINLVAVKDDETVGFVSALVNEPNPPGKYLWERMRPYIGFVGVAPGNQGCGIGGVLVSRVSRVALQRTNRYRIFLECEVENERAKGLYEKLGFKVMPPDEVERTFARPPHRNSLILYGWKSLFNGEYPAPNQG